MSAPLPDPPTDRPGGPDAARGMSAPLPDPPTDRPGGPRLFAA
jgi:hypothetical protein